MARELTGYHVLATTCAAFGVIISVNLVLAVKAVSTFPGIEVANSYVASQNFNARRDAQQALGWQAVPIYDGKTLRLVLSGQDGRPVRAATLSALVGRSTAAAEDVTPDFRFEEGAYATDLTLPPGQWLVRLQAEAADGTAFEQRLSFWVKGV